MLVFDTLIYLYFDIFHILFGKLIKTCYCEYIWKQSNNYLFIFLIKLVGSHRVYSDSLAPLYVWGFFCVMKK